MAIRRPSAIRNFHLQFSDSSVYSAMVVLSVIEGNPKQNLQETLIEPETNVIPSTYLYFPLSGPCISVAKYLKMSRFFFFMSVSIGIGRMLPCNNVRVAHELAEPNSVDGPGFGEKAPQPDLGVL